MMKDFLILGSVLGILFLIGRMIPDSDGLGEGGLDDLGVIVPCRPEDKDSSRPAREQRWCLWTKNKSRILGRHKTKKSALRQEKLIQLKKKGVL